MTMRLRHLARSTILATVTAVTGTVCVASSAAEAQVTGGRQTARQCEVQFEPRSPADSASTVLEKQPSGVYNAFQGGGVRYRCAGDDVTIEADSAAFYGDLNILYMIGNVHYREPRAELDADQLTYYRSDEWVLAQGNVLARMDNGSTMRGPSAEYYRAVPAIRPLQRVVATGRPTFTLVPQDSTGAPQEPVTIVADRVVAEGDSLVYAGGQVRITRPDVDASADSAALDEGRGFARLMRSPRIEGRGERVFTLTGNTIDLFSRERELERVLSMGAARVVSEDVTVTADTLDLRVEEGELERAFAWGPGRARAASPGREIVADSLDVLLPGQRLRTVHALGGARIESDPDSASIVSDVRDWLAGDTVIANFDTTRAPGDTTSQPRLSDLLAEGDARSFQQIGPDSGRTARPSIHYVRGRTINVLFDDGRPQSVKVSAPDSGLTSGVYLDATGASAERGEPRTPAPPVTPPANPSSPPPVPPPGGLRDD
ncbi:MAG TPA: hypothetical protein VGE02_13245 [Gemmatimonadales bacterium]